MTPPKAPKDVPVPVDQFIAGDASKGVAVAGLLAHKPELTKPGTDGESPMLTTAEWQKQLDKYLKTPIDPIPTAPIDEPESDPA